MSIRYSYTNPLSTHTHKSPKAQLFATNANRIKQTKKEKKRKANLKLK